MAITFRTTTETHSLPSRAATINASLLARHRVTLNSSPLLPLNSRRNSFTSCMYCYSPIPAISLVVINHHQFNPFPNFKRFSTSLAASLKTMGVIIFGLAASTVQACWYMTSTTSYSCMVPSRNTKRFLRLVATLSTNSGFQHPILTRIHREMQIRKIDCLHTSRPVSWIWNRLVDGKFTEIETPSHEFIVSTALPGLWIPATRLVVHHGRDRARRDPYRSP